MASQKLGFYLEALMMWNHDIAILEQKSIDLIRRIQTLEKENESKKDPFLEAKIIELYLKEIEIGLKIMDHRNPF